MSSQPTFAAPAFGDWLKRQRGDLSYEQLAIKLRKHLNGTDLKVARSALKRYEQGRIPPWPLLFAMAEVFGESPAAVAAQVVTAIQSSGVTGAVTVVDQSSPSIGGVTDESPASDQRARIRDLEDQLKASEARFREVQNAARAAFNQLGKVAEHIGKGEDAERAAAQRRGAHRKPA